jgi:HD-like signal output (HDOD) protein
MSESATLIDILQERLASDNFQLPVFHPSALKLHEILATDNFTINEMATVITEDPALASHVLRTANSSFFSGMVKVATIEDAVKRLGSKQITDIFTMVTQKTSYEVKTPLMKTYSTPLWQHAIASALGAKWLAERAGYPQLTQEAFLAGLLHDVGQLLILKVLEELALSGHDGLNLTKAMINNVFDSLHTTQGALLLETWGFPEQYREVVRCHHLEEGYDASNTLLGLVRLVNIACHKLGIGLRHEPWLVLASTNEADQLDISELILAELEIVLEDALALC